MIETSSLDFKTKIILLKNNWGKEDSHLFIKFKILIQDKSMLLRKLIFKRNQNK